MKKLAVLSFCALALLCGSLPFVGAEEQEGPAAVVVTGQNYSLLAVLGKDLEPGATPLNALKVKEAKGADGAVIEGLAGKTLHYLPTKSADELLLGDANKGKTVTVTGKLHASACVLIVESFTVSDSDDEWDELPVGTMSSQQIL